MAAAFSEDKRREYHKTINRVTLIYEIGPCSGRVRLLLLKKRNNQPTSNYYEEELVHYSLRTFIHILLAVDCCWPVLHHEEKQEQDERLNDVK